MEWGKFIRSLPQWMIVLLLLMISGFLFYSHQTGRFISWNPFGITSPIGDILDKTKIELEEQRKKTNNLRSANEELKISNDVVFDAIRNTKPLDDLGIKLIRMAINGEGPFGENIAILKIHLVSAEADELGILDEKDMGLAAACKDSPVFGHEIFVRSDWIENEGKPLSVEKGLADGWDSIIHYPGACTKDSHLPDSKYEIWAYKEGIQERFRVDLEQYDEITTIAQLLVSQRSIEGRDSP